MRDEIFRSETHEVYTTALFFFSKTWVPKKSTRISKVNNKMKRNLAIFFPDKTKITIAVVVLHPHVIIIYETCECMADVMF